MNAFRRSTLCLIALATVVAAVACSEDDSTSDSPKGTGRGGTGGTTGKAGAGGATGGSAGNNTAGAAGAGAAAGSSTAGAGGTISAGAAGSATAGSAGSGAGGTSSAGSAGSSAAGSSGSSTGGSGGSSAGASSGGTGGSAGSGGGTAGSGGTSTAGNGGTSTAGNGGANTAGNGGANTAGSAGSAGGNGIPPGNDFASAFADGDGDSACSTCLRANCPSQIVDCGDVSVTGTGVCMGAVGCLANETADPTLTSYNCAFEKCAETNLSLEVNEMFVCVADKCATQCFVSPGFPCTNLGK